MIRKFICGLFMVVSLFVIIGFFFTINSAIQELGFEFGDFSGSFSELEGEQKITVIWSIVTLVIQSIGIPLVIFLVSLIGVSLPAKVAKD
jgi:predicted membrane protein